ncbi:alpha/beta hydrolase [Novosphingobium humi]|uniref:Alpha/beta hydrolase n=1 Tax=Novosphingobium humi TaxID=2282397 RepID=A0ABY7U0V0_9SPHN|nr:alpha/beta hydrolase [Novosphingobium humi]WCT79157.1 alpha/beta hydrolase [Novosphingobium humi]
MSSNRIARHPHPYALAASLPKTLPDARIRYGEDSPVQFADLRIPKGHTPAGGFPVIIFIHGGGWLADWTKDYSAPFVEALTSAGFATWDVEFRRMGNCKGGYPSTFQDVARAADHARALAPSFPLDLDRVIAIGHSSGGHLALWLAGRGGLSSESPLYAADPIRLKGVISIAGVNDLDYALEHGTRADILQLLDTIREQADPLMAQTSPARLLPMDVPQTLIVGTAEDRWRRDMTHHYAQAALRAGDAVQLLEPEGLDHFDVVDPAGPAFELVVAAAKAMV